jgi:type II secretory pathway pseudopilin PulG
MRCGFRLQNCKIAKLPNRNRHQRGYMMITLILSIALITIGLLAVFPEIKQQILRDREEEMRHRGTAYMRAIQHFYKKFGRYPTRVEELENTNNLRFLRKRYKDPLNVDRVTGKEKDFKFLTQQDITLNSGPLLGQTPGQGGVGGQGGAGGPSAFGGQGGPQGAGGFGGAPGPLGGMQGGIGGLGAQPGGGQPNANSGSQPSGSGGSSNSSDANDENSNLTGSSSSSSSPSNSSPGASNSGPNPSSGLNGPTFGGGPILGVASTSKDKTIRVFYDKNHYNDWLFIYLPQADLGGLLTGPVSLNGPAAGNLGGLGQSVIGGQIQGQGGPGQGGFGQPNGGLPTQPPPQNSGQAPPQN